MMPALRYRGWKWRAMGLLLFGRQQAALDVFESMLQEFPGDSYGLASKAHLQAQLGHKRDALRTFEELVTADGENARHWFNYGFLLEEMGDGAPARRIIQVHQVHGADVCVVRRGVTRADQRHDVGSCLAEGAHGRGTEALRDLALDPLGRDVAAEGGDQHVLLAPLHVQEAVRVERAEVAGGPPVGRGRGLAQVAGEQVFATGVAAVHQVEQLVFALAELLGDGLDVGEVHDHAVVGTAFGGDDVAGQRDFQRIAVAVQVAALALVVGDAVAGVELQDTSVGRQLLMQRGASGPGQHGALLVSQKVERRNLQLTG